MFEDAPTTSPVRPSDLPQKYAIVMITLIPIAIVLVVVMGIVHCVRKRNARIIAARQKADVEMTPRTPAPSAIPNGMASTNKANAPHLPSRSVDKAMPPLPRVHSQVPSMYLGKSSPLANNGVSAEEVKPLSFFHPGNEGGKGKGKGMGPERVWYRA